MIHSPRGFGLGERVTVLKRPTVVRQISDPSRVLWTWGWISWPPPDLARSGHLGLSLSKGATSDDKHPHQATKHPHGDTLANPQPLAPPTQPISTNSPAQTHPNLTFPGPNLSFRTHSTRPKTRWHILPICQCTPWRPISFWRRPVILLVIFAD